MARHRIVGGGAGLLMVLSLVALVLACRGREPAPAATPPPADTPPTASEAPAETTPPAAAMAAASNSLPTGDELMAYLTWLRDWKQLTLRSKAELDAVTEQAATKYSLRDTGKIAQDPDVLAVIARNAEANKAHFALKAKPFPAYMGARNEEALERARQRYGDAVVDWVLEREGTVASVLSE